MISKVLKRSTIALAFAASVAIPTASYAADGLVEEALKVISALETETGMPIAVLERTGDDPGEFWYRAMKKLCTKTGDDWCEEDVRVLSDTTNTLGWSRVLVYKNVAGIQKEVCALLPPRPSITSGYVSTALSPSGKTFNWDQLPTPNETESWLLLMHAGNCLSKKGSKVEQKRAYAFATMALTLAQGDASFVSGKSLTPARSFATFLDDNTTRWGVNVGERILLDLWKKETGEILQKNNCPPRIVTSSNLNTDLINRDSSIGDEDCDSYGRSGGKVSDENLWLWGLRSRYNVGLPPKEYKPFKSFVNLAAAVKYMWATSGQLANQK